MSQSRLPVVLALAMLAGCDPARSFRAAKTVQEIRPAHELRLAPGTLGEEPFRTEPPHPTRVRPRVLPAPKEVRLSNGIRVVMLERHEFPSASAVLVLGRGSVAAAPGVAAVYTEALTGDSDEYKAGEAFDYLAFVGGRVDTRAWQEAVAFQVTALAPLLVSALSHAAPMFASPLLTGDALDEARTHIAAAHDAARDDPETIAEETLRAQLFPAPSPYGVPIYSVPGGDGVSNRAARDFRAQHLVAENVSVACAGDLSPTVIEKALETALGKLPTRSAAPAPPSAPIPRAGTRKVVVIDRPGASQTRVAIGWPGPQASDPGALTLEVLAAASGGHLSSRLNLLVRKELGATYGVRMSSEPLRDAGVIEISAAIETGRTVDALEGLFFQLERLRTEALAEGELTNAKLRSLYDLEQSNSRGLALVLARSLAAGEPSTQVVSHNTRVDAVTAEDVRASAEKWLGPAEARVVIVGDAARIVDGLRALGIGEVTVTAAR